MTDQSRVEFQAELEKIDWQVLGLFALVGECVANVTAHVRYLTSGED